MKSEKFSQVSEQTLKIILLHGLAGVTFSRVAQAARVSRSWLYKYVGKKPEDLISAATLHFGSLAARLGERTPAHDRATYLEHLAWAVERLCGLAVEHPWFIPLYHRYKGTPTPMGDMIRQVELTLIRERTEDIQRCIPSPRTAPASLAELIVSIDIALAFRWQHTEPRSPQRMDELKELSRVLFSSLL